MRRETRVSTWKKKKVRHIKCTYLSCSKLSNKHITESIASPLDVLQKFIDIIFSFFFNLVNINKFM